MRVLIVDDHEVVRRGVRSLLLSRADVNICGEAIDGREAIEKAQELRPDIVVMDISMPRMNGLEATRSIAQSLPQTKIIMLSQHDVPEMMKQAFSMGAHAYVVKSAIADQLFTALDAVQAGDTAPQEVIYGSTEVNIDVKEILQRSVVFERALREAEERLRLAQQVSRVGTFEFNVKTGVGRWTPEMENLYGLQPCTFPGTQSAWEQMIHSDDRLPMLEKVDAAAANGNRFEGEWRVIWPDGSIHWLLGRAFLFRDEAGMPERWVGVNIDITERKLSEERAERLSRLLDLSFDAILLRDTNDCVRFWNLAAQELYGWSAKEAHGQVTHTLLNTRFPEPVEMMFATLKRDGRWEGELTHTKKDGDTVKVRSRWGLVRNWETGQLWVLETNTDITARRAGISQTAENPIPAALQARLSD